MCERPGAASTARALAQRSVERELKRVEVAVPDQLRTTSTKLVYLFFELVGEAHPTEIGDALDVPLLSLFPALDVLVEHGLVVRDGATYRLAGKPTVGLA